MYDNVVDKIIGLCRSMSRCLPASRKKMTDTRIHPVTGQVLSRQVRVQTVTFGSLSTEVEVQGWYPEDGSDSIHSGRDLEEKEEVLQELRKAYGKRDDDGE